eukprot:GFYU01009223.1.p1 GENE.GFYU01009223.1~~GFYU01009223.1.p1  ORF type:complete len:973 (-),score=330.11 GFYU01009223.1:216-3134(-)
MTLHRYSPMHMIVVVGLVAGIALLAPVNALYEDQVGNFDWNQHYVGKVVETAFLMARRSKVFVSTESGAVASVNASGDLSWRFVLPDGETADRLVAAGTKRLVISSSSGRYIRMLDAGGKLIWNEESSANSCAEELHRGDVVSVGDLNDDGEDEVAGIACNQVFVRSGDDGAAKWEITDASSGVSLQRVALDKSRKTLYTIGFARVTDQGADELQVKSYNVKDGSLKNTHKTTAKSSKFSTAPSSLLVLENAVVVLHSDGKSITSLEFGSDDAKSVSTSSLVKACPAPQQAVVTDINMPTSFIVGCGSESFALITSSLTVTKSFDKGRRSFGYNNGQLVSVMLQQNAVVESFDVQSEKTSVINVDLPLNQAERGPTVSVFVGPTSTVSSPVIYIVTADYSFAGIVGEEVWVRDEALATIKDVEFVDFPPDIIDAAKDSSSGKVLPTRFGLDHLMESVNGLLKLLDVDMWMDPKKAAAVFNGGGAEKGSLSRDSFGLRKMIVTTTESGKVIVLHSETGAVIWHKYFPLTDAEIVKLFVTRPASGKKPECVILGRSLESSQGPTFLSWFDPLTGSEFDYQRLDFNVQHAFLIPKMDAELRHILVIVDTRENVHVFPQSADAIAAFDAYSSSVYYFTINDSSDSGIVGFHVEKTGDNKYKGVSHWNMNIPAREKIAAYDTSSHMARVNAPARVVGDRTLMHKYLNPNVMAVLTSSTGQFNEGELHCYIVDTVVGTVLHHQIVKNAQEPVNVVVMENWVVFSYWNTKQHQVGLTVVEMFEETTYEWSLGTLLTLWAQADSEEATTFTSYAAPKPIVMHQSYVFPTSFTHMTVTHTMRGITSKQILLGLVSGQVYGLDKSFVDPRRPEQLSATDKEEMLKQYQPEIPIVRTSMLSYNRTVEKMRGIQTAPALLESACITLTYGLDLFYNRVMPSKSYDVLNDDFNYALLSVGLGVIVMANYVVKYLADKREVSNLWQ